MAGGLELPHLERTSLRLYEKNVLGSSVKKKIPKQTNNNSKNKTKTPKQTKLPPPKKQQKTHQPQKKINNLPTIN